MEQDLNNEILDKITKTCICKAISRAVIRKAIRNGAKSLLEVQQVTGAGSGPCRGRRCTERIIGLLEEENG